MDTDSIDKLKRKRSTIRALTTKLVNKIESILKETDEENAQKNEELEVCGDQLPEKSEILKDLDKQIELSIDVEEIEAEITATEEYQDRIIEYQGKIRRYLASQNKTFNDQPASNLKVLQDDQPSFQFREPKGVKLPKLSMNKFYGESSLWLDFWSQYVNAIHENNSLSEVEKFTYLKNLLGGIALNAVRGFALTNENYEKAIQLLKNRFGRQDIVMNAHMTKLLNLEPVKNSANIKAFRSLYDECEIQIRNLESLGVTTGSYGQLLCPILLKLIPEDVSLEFERKRKTKHDFDIQELVEFIRSELECREAVTILNETKKAKYSTNSNYQRNESYKRNFTRNNVPTAAFTTTIKAQCIFCKGDHDSFGCESMSAEDKRNKLLKGGKCFRCFRYAHLSYQCRVKMNACKRCLSRNHHESVCVQSADKGSNSKSMTGNISTSSDCRSSENSALISSVAQFRENKSGKVYLQTCVAKICTNDFKSKPVRILMDNASMRSFVTKDLARELRLKVLRKEKLLVYTFGNRKPLEKVYDVAKIELCSVTDPSCGIKLEVLITPEISGVLLSTPDHTLRGLLKEKGLQSADVCLSESGTPISVLIGADSFWKVNSGRTERLNKNLFAVQTTFGWTIQGRVNYREENSVHRKNFEEVNVEAIFAAKIVTENDSISDQLKMFWDIESLGITQDCDENSAIELQTLRAFEENVAFVNGRYQVKLPFKDKINVADNYRLAKQRLFSLSKRLNSDPSLYEEYKGIINEQLKEGIMEPVDPHDESEGIYYMPHHPVIRHDKETTKLRIVFDASSSDKNCYSLNENLLAGPNLNPNLLTILLKFREHKIGIIADIEKAFLQISLAKEDRDFVRVLWGEQLIPELKVYRMARVTFGVKASPFLLAATVKHHLRKYVTSHPVAYKVVNDSLYVDDLITGTNSVEEAQSLANDAKFILSEANMNLRKWRTSSKELSQIWHEENFEIHPTVNYLVPIKVLGMVWNTATDEFKFELTSMLESLESRRNTKRSVLRLSCKLFDPIGIISPFVIRVKILFQEMWEHGLDWDEELTEDLKTKWNNWCKEVIELQAVAIPRHYFPSELNKDASQLQLHIFCDASETAYGAIAYFRYVRENGQSGVRIVTAKARVAPVRKVTLPRLELLATLIGARLCRFLRKIFNVNIRYIMWSDSTIALSWIKGSAKQWKPFVGNRVSEIQSVTDPQNWRHCSGRDNPADILSRGCSVAELVRNKKWWEGPSWLTQSEDKWPENQGNPIGIENAREEKRSKLAVAIHCLAKEDYRAEPILDIDRYNSINRIYRITAWVKRFIANSKTKDKDRRLTSVLTAEEIWDAEIFWVKKVQSECFPTELKHLQKKRSLSKDSSIRDLNPFIDKLGLIVVGGRLQQSKYEFFEKHPILLPTKHRLSELLVRQAHEKVFHLGVASTLVQIREKFWLIRGRQVIKALLRKCSICQRYNSRPGVQITAPLPADRMEKSSPFAITGLDFAGPLFIKDSEIKHYILLCTCAVTRAIHLELVADLTTTTFLLAFRRFIARRGLSSVIYSDNAKTFKRADFELKHMWKIINHTEVKEFYKSHGITWKYIIERGAWWGGFYERMVRSVKVCLRKTVGKTSLRADELETVLIEIEAVINSRPITFVYSDPQEPFPLTPAHFLIGKRLLSLPSIRLKLCDSPSTKKVLLKRFNYRERILDQFWKKWKYEYLLNLRSANSQVPVSVNNDFEINNIVLISDDRFPRNMWKLGKIIEVYPGRDGKVRSCSVKTQNGTLKRPVQLLYRLEVQDP